MFFVAVNATNCNAIKGGDTMKKANKKIKPRTNLKLLRVSKKMTQAEFADFIGVDRGRYSGIESGVRNGRVDFWTKLQAAFPAANIGELMKVDEN